MKMRVFRVFLQQEKSLSYLRRKSIREIFSFLLIMAGPVLKLVEEAYLFRIFYVTLRYVHVIMYAIFYRF